MYIGELVRSKLIIDDSVDRNRIRQSTDPETNTMQYAMKPETYAHVAKMYYERHFGYKNTFIITLSRDPDTRDNYQVVIMIVRADKGPVELILDVEHPNQIFDDKTLAKLALLV